MHSVTYSGEHFISHWSKRVVIHPSVRGRTEARILDASKGFTAGTPAIPSFAFSSTDLPRNRVERRIPFRSIARASEPAVNRLSLPVRFPSTVRRTTVLRRPSGANSH